MLSAVLPGKHDGGSVTGCNAALTALAVPCVAGASKVADVGSAAGSRNAAALVCWRVCVHVKRIRSPSRVCDGEDVGGVDDGYR